MFVCFGVCVLVCVVVCIESLRQTSSNLGEQSISLLFFFIFVSTNHVAGGRDL